MHNEYDLLGQIIKEARISAGLTREQLGSKINKSPRYIASIENEHKYPSFKTLSEIIVTLNIDSNLLFYPEKTNDKNYDKERIFRMLDKCNKHELNIITATLEAITDK